MLLEMMYQYVLFQVFHKLSLFLVFADIMLHKNDATIFDIYDKKILQVKFRTSFTKFLRNLTMISIFKKVRSQQLRKAKY